MLFGKRSMKEREGKGRQATRRYDEERAAQRKGRKGRSFIGEAEKALLP